MSDRRSDLALRILPWAVRTLLRLLGLTLRYRIDGEDRMRALLDAGRPVIVASLHGWLPLGMRALRPYRPLIMVSQSRDGERVTRMAEPLGFRMVRGSSSRGGVRALLEMVRRLVPGELAVHVVDGPRGPAGEVKPGLFLLAQRAGAVIVPAYAAATRRIVTRSWDRMQIPLPFARIHIRYGEPLEVPQGLPEAELDRMARELEERFVREAARIEAEAGHASAPPDDAEHCSRFPS